MPIIIPAVASLPKDLVVHVRLGAALRKEIDAQPESKVIKRPGVIKLLLAEALKARKSSAEPRVSS